MANNKSIITMALFLALNMMFSNIAYSSYVSYPPPLKYCPRDTLKLDVCADVLGLVHLQIGGAQKRPCCSLIKNIIDINAAACLCTAVHANILELVKLNLNVDLTALVNYCGCKLPTGFQCPT